MKVKMLVKVLENKIMLKRCRDSQFLLLLLLL